MKIIDEEMEAVGGTKMSMPKLLPKELWERTGRWNDMGSELIRLKDRKGEDFCLAPTHEEIVTSVVASGVRSKTELPLRLYQIGDKYRDEARPRFGLLRGREFVMKDMYSFDATQADALKAYEEVRGAYHAIMNRLELPYAVAEADSGNIGGNLSHEFHALTDVGEDTLLHSKETGYFANVEKAKSDTTAKISRDLKLGSLPPKTNARHILETMLSSQQENASMRATVFKDPQQPEITFIALTDATYEANEYLVKSHFKLGVEFTVEPLTKESIEGLTQVESNQNLRVVFDLAFSSESCDEHTKSFVKSTIETFERFGVKSEHAHVKIAKVGDKTLVDEKSQIQGVLEERKGIEVGHLFYLGTKYSAPLKASIPTDTGMQAIEMGCYGIGVSRLLAVSVETSNDDNGIIWPRAIAPFQVMIIPNKDEAETGVQLYNTLSAIPGLSGEIMIDDRAKKHGIGYRTKESEFIGIPYSVAIGKKWQPEGLIEVKTRKTGEVRELTIDQLRDFFKNEYSDPSL